MIGQRNGNRFLLDAVPNFFKLCLCVSAMGIVSGCANDKLGADKIEAQDARGPIPPLSKPPEFQARKIVSPAPDIKQITVAELSELDIPLYPGAQPASSANQDVTANKSYGITLGVFVTSDSIDKVVAFYRTQFPSSGNLSLASSSHAEWLDDKAGEKRTVRIMATDPSKGNGIKTIELSSVKETTQIKLMRVASGKLK